jgi:hypothetical protein
VNTGGADKVAVMGVPDNISISSEGPDNQGRIRAFATSNGNELGAATALPDDQAPGGWVISDMHFRDNEHWPSLGQTLLDRLVAQIEQESLLGTRTAITASLDNLRFRDAVKAYGPRITYQRG